MVSPAAPPTSLQAPSRARTITIDASLPTTQSPQMQSFDRSQPRSIANVSPDTTHRAPLFPDFDDEPNSASSSESDDDENDALNTSSGPVTNRITRANDDRLPSLDATRRSNSALSLESLQNESDAGEDDDAEEIKCQLNGDQEKDTERTKRSGEQLAADATDDAATKRVKLDPGHQPQHDDADDEEVVFVSANKKADAGNNIPTNSNDTQIPDEKGTVTQRQVAEEQLPTANNVDNVHHASSNVEQLETPQPPVVNAVTTDAVMSEEGDRYLVNVAPVSADDGSGWDRSVFFSFRSQRFGFFSKTYLSTFSPFAAVASGMDGVTSKSVCAVCGSGGRLLSCMRCPLAFHQHCVDPLGHTLSETWFCTACKAVKGQDLSIRWDPEIPPPELPSPATGFARLIVDANEGNPMDFVFNPTLFRYYRKECGGDWLRCHKCKRVRIADDGVLTESVRVPFECSFAFWLPDELRSCDSPLSADPKFETVKKVEAYIANRSRRRNALFFYGFGEEDRIDFGFPPLETKGAIDDSVIVIDDDASDVAPADIGTAGVGNPSTTMRDSGEITKRAVRKQPLRQGTDCAHLSSIESSRGLTDSSPDPSKSATKAQTVISDDAAIAKDSQDASIVAVPASALHGEQHGSKSTASKLGGSSAEKRMQANEAPKQTGVTAQHDVFDEDLENKSPRPTVSEYPDQRRQMSERNSIATEAEVADYGISAVTPVAEIAREAVGSKPQSEYKNDADLGSTREARPADKTVTSPSRFNKDLQEQILEYIATLDLDTDVEDCLTDMALDGDKSLMRLYKVYHRNNIKFKRHASRLANKSMGRDPAGIAS